jgi:hypothetical protein
MNYLRRTAMKNWISNMLGAKKHKSTFNEVPINATDDYVVVNRQELDRLIAELNNHYERNAVIEEVVQHVAKMKGFGQDTVDSMTIYIRELKR